MVGLDFVGQYVYVVNFQVFEDVVGKIVDLQGITSTGWSEKNAAKFSEFSLNVPKLADWLCMGWSVCQAAAKVGNSKRGTFFAPACILS